MGFGLNLGCDCCGECNFGCDPCINSVTVTVCGLSITFAWPEEGSTGCGYIYRTTNVSRCCGGSWASCPDEQFHNGCFHTLYGCLDQLGTEVVLDEWEKTPTSIDCHWVKQVIGVCTPQIELEITFKAGKKADVQVTYTEAWSLFYRAILSGECCSSTIDSNGIPANNGTPTNECFPCSSDTISPAYLRYVHFTRQVIYEAEVTYDDCSDFWNAKNVDWLSTSSTNTYTPSGGINLSGRSCSGFECACGFPFELYTDTVTIPALFCSSPTTAATIEFNA